ncbi:MAG: glycosyltransferase [Pseudomonadales bacterium]|nr:glycosyltransferase [Pseudomonadales bacterium]
MSSSKSLYAGDVNSPLVSVVMTLYNGEKYLRSAIESVLQQTYLNFELVIVDDCSEDSSLAIANEYAGKDDRVRVFSNPKNLMLSKSLNRALELSKGVYIARMDQDDISLPDRFLKQVAFMESSLKTAIVGCDIAILDESGKRISQRNYFETDEEIRKNIFFFSPFCHPAVMIRKNAIEHIGGYDQYYSPADDYELYFRLGKQGRLHNIKERLFEYRLMPTSMTHDSTELMERKTIEVRKKYSSHLAYKASIAASIYNLVHELSLNIFSSSFRMKIFKFIRGKIK